MTSDIDILVVEDNQAIREGLVDLLELSSSEHSINVRTAPNGVVALEKLRQQTPDLIISDIVMPEMDGIELVRQVRQNPAWARVPFIFLTARMARDEMLHAKLSGADQYLTKPFSGEDLWEMVDGQLRRSAQLRSRHEQAVGDLRRSLLQVLNHEFRTPLTYVMAYYEMLADGLRRPETQQDLKQYLNGLKTGYYRLTRLVENLIMVIDLSVEEGRQRVRDSAGPVNDLAELLEGVVDARAQLLRGDLVNVALEVEPLPPVLGNRAGLQTIFSHLLENAVKFAHFARGEAGEVVVSTAVSANTVRITFQDNGPGFEPHIAPRLFTLFYQHERNRYEQQGAGVGLTLAKELIELHNGRIEVHSEPGVGSTFTAVLPVLQPNANHTLQPGRMSSGRVAATILIVEDDLNLLYGLQDLLELSIYRYDISVHIAASAPEALAQMAYVAPHLIISDITMFGMDGYAFLQTVRERTEWVDIPFIFLTARSTHQDLQRGWRSGVEEYITKPYDVPELLALVNKQLDRYFTTRSLSQRDLRQLKHEILNLLPAGLELPLSSVGEYTAVLDNTLQHINTARDLRSTLEGMQTSSARLTRMVEDFIALVEFETEEAVSAFALQARRLDNAGTLVYEVAELHAVRTGETLHGMEVHADAEMPGFWGSDGRILDSLQRLLAAGLHCLPAHARSPITLSSSHNVAAARFGIQYAQPLPAEDAQIIHTVLDTTDTALIQMAPYAPGLRIATLNAMLHNGTVRFRNAPAAEFIFEIPLKPVNEETAVG